MSAIGYELNIHFIYKKCRFYCTCIAVCVATGDSRHCGIQVCSENIPVFKTLYHFIVRRICMSQGRQDIMFFQVSRKFQCSLKLRSGAPSLYNAGACDDLFIFIRIRLPDITRILRATLIHREVGTFDVHAKELGA